MYSAIYEHKDVIAYLEKKNLLTQYKKAKEGILNGNFSGNRLKVRNPKSQKIYYFRINRKYRALAQKRGDVLVVFDVDNHQ